MISREHVVARRFLSLADGIGIPMPEPIVQARRRIEHVAAHERAVAAMHPLAQPHEIIRQFADAVLEAADAGEVPSQDVAAAVEEAERKRRAQELALEVARMAVDSSWMRLRQAISHETPGIARSLSRTLDATLEEVRKVAGDLEGLDLTRPEAFFGSAKAGKAYQALLGARERYVILRELQRQLGGGATLGELALFRNIRELWESIGVGWQGHLQSMVTVRPWPQPIDGPEYVLWVATGMGGAGVVPEPWVPTPAELEEATGELASPLMARVGPGSVMIGRGPSVQPDRRAAGR